MVLCNLNNHCRKNEMSKVVIFLCILLSVIPVSASNLQRTYTSRDWEYRLTDMLSREAGVVGTPGVSPLPASGLLMVLDRVDTSRLSPESREDYEELYSRLSGDTRETVFSHDWMSVEVEPQVNLGVNIAKYSDFDWSNTGDISLKDRRNETLTPFRYENPFLSLHARVYFGEYFQLESGIIVSNNNHHLYESTIGFLISSYDGRLLTMGMPDQYPASLQFDFPWRAGISLGNEYFSFIMGRYPFSVGTGVTGNLIAGDNFTYQEIAQLTFMNNYFTYSLSVTHFDQQIPEETDDGIGEGTNNPITSISQRQFSGDQMYRIIHRFDINIMDRVRLSMDLATLYNTDNSFDLRFFYPFFFHHNLSNYTNETEMSYYDEANNMMGFTLEGALPWGLSASFSFVLDQAQTYAEKASAVPPAYGMQANVKHTKRFNKGRLDSFFEFVLTNPYLYLNGKTYADGEYNYNLDYIVGYYSMNFSDVGYSGYVWGPDSIVMALGSEYISDSNFSVALNALYRIQGKKGYRLRSSKSGISDHHYTYVDMTNAVFTDEDGKNPLRTPSGPWNEVEHMLRLSASFTYTFDVPNIELYLGLAGHVYWNYGGDSSRDGVFRPQASIGVRWTGLDKAWWGR